MKRLLSLLSAIILTSNIYAQSPQKMSFQAVIRDANASLIIDQVVGMRIIILQGSVNGTAVYVETHTPQTNANGLVSLEIGNGTIVSGDFSAIDWANGPYFIQAETDPNGGTNYTISGTSQLLSVPYALYAKTAETVTGGMAETDPIFGNSLASGITASDTASWNSKSENITETDPVYGASLASGISEADTTRWNNKLDSYTESDPTFGASLASGISEADTTRWNDKLDSYTETDPLFGTSVAYNITATDTSYWNNKPDSYTESDPLFAASAAGSIDASDTVNWNNKLEAEIDGDSTNEIQSLSLSGSDLSISDGNSVTLPVSPWSVNGVNTYFSGGLVGVGVSSPTAMLDVYDNVGYNFFKFVSTDNVYTTWTSTRSGVDDYQLGIDGGNNKFLIANVTTGYFPIAIHRNNIGIGMLNPEAPLHVNDFMKLEPRSTAPPSPTKGVIYYDSTDNKLKVYTGSGWENLN